MSVSIMHPYVIHALIWSSLPMIRMRELLMPRTFAMSSALRCARKRNAENKLNIQQTFPLDYWHAVRVGIHCFSFCSLVFFQHKSHRFLFEMSASLSMLCLWRSAIDLQRNKDEGNKSTKTQRKKERKKKKEEEQQNRGQKKKTRGRRKKKKKEEEKEEDEEDAQ